MLLVLTAGYATLMKADETAKDTVNDEQATDESGRVEDTVPTPDYHPSIKVEFKLLNSEGKQVTQDDFQGKYVLLTFGYTHCEHICPTILSDMARTLKESGNDTVGIFISVDSERDTPAITEDYASKFSQKITGLSGSYEDVAAAANNFNVRYSITKTQNHYMVQHSSDIFYIDPDGQLKKIFTFNSLPIELEK